MRRIHSCLHAPNGISSLGISQLALADIRVEAVAVAYSHVVTSITARPFAGRVGFMPANQKKRLQGLITQEMRLASNSGSALPKIEMRAWTAFFIHCGVVERVGNKVGTSLWAGSNDRDRWAAGHWQSQLDSPGEIAAGTSFAPAVRISDVAVSHGDVIREPFAEEPPSCLDVQRLFDQTDWFDNDSLGQPMGAFLDQPAGESKFDRLDLRQEASSILNDVMQYGYAGTSSDVPAAAASRKRSRDQVYC